MNRLGVAARVLGDPRLRAPAQKAQPGAEAAQLSQNLLHLRDVLVYLRQLRISCFRLPSTILPLGPGNEAICATVLEEMADLCCEVGSLAQASGIRLSVHPPLHANLATPDEQLAAQVAKELTLYGTLLDALGCGPEAVIVLHVGGAYGEPALAMERFLARCERLPAFAFRRIAVEADENCFDVATLLWLRRYGGIPVIFDSLHVQINNPRGMPIEHVLELAISSWPPGVRPKIHFSSQRTEAHLREARGGSAQVIPPRRGQHADFINPFEFASFLRAARSLPSFDIMLEAKAADLALLRLRDDLRDYAPDVAARVY